jgi:hypothetical protein
MATPPSDIFAHPGVFTAFFVANSLADFGARTTD